jgi:hypothetical protein
MKKIVVSILAVAVLGVVGWWALRSGRLPLTVVAPTHTALDPKNAAYVIDGQQISLINGKSEISAAPGSASKIVTSYFGNDVETDLNNDGRIDTAFILTQTTGGSGVFYYAVAALNTEHGYRGSDGYLLGDRVAPQATTASPSLTQKGVVVFNYADRAPGEPMTTKPSVGKSVYLKLDVARMQWGIVLPQFEGEAE